MFLNVIQSISPSYLFLLKGERKEDRRTNGGLFNVACFNSAFSSSSNLLITAIQDQRGSIKINHRGYYPGYH